MQSSQSSEKIDDSKEGVVQSCSPRMHSKPAYLLADSETGSLWTQTGRFARLPPRFWTKPTCGIAMAVISRRAILWIVAWCFLVAPVSSETKPSPGPFERLGQATRKLFPQKKSNVQVKTVSESKAPSLWGWLRRSPAKPPRTPYQFWAEERPNEEQTVRK